MALEVGDPVVLISAEGLEAYGLKDGTLGMCNNIIRLPETDEEYIYFMPKGTRQNYVIKPNRVEVDQEAKEAGKSHM